MSRHSKKPGDWFDLLGEGIILVRDGSVTSLNNAARLLMDVTQPLSGDLTLFNIVRDHRIEQAFHQQTPVEVRRAGRTLSVEPFSGGIIIRNTSEIKKAHEDTRELLAVLSHELRTPVATIRATLEALEGDIPRELATRFLTRATEETLRLTRLLEDLTVDVRPPDYRRIFLPEVIARVVTLIQPLYRQHDITLVQEIEGLTVWADNDKLMQIMINLLENAAIHGPKCQTVTLRAFLQSDPEAHIVVQDQGQPIPETNFEPLFKPHARGQSVKAKGTGLGLYIVRSIAEKWQGTAWGRPLAHGNEFGFSVHVR